MTGFWVLCGLMIAGALGLLLPRLLRGVKAPLDDAALTARRRLQSLEAAHQDGHLSEADYQQRRGEIGEQLLNVVAPDQSGTRSPATALGLVLLVPVAALAIYLKIGTPGAIDGSAAEPPLAGDLPAMIQQLRDRLEDNPQDVDGWFLLGRSLRTLNDFAGAAQAYGEALKLVPDQPVLLVEYAEALAFMGEGPQLPDAARAALDRAMAQDPTLQKGLWLKGMDAFNQKQPAEATRYWEALLAQLEPESPEALQIEQQLALVRRQAPTATAQAPAPEPAAPASADASLVVDISLAPELVSQVSPGDTLFVFARAHNGPPMPLAIQRLTAGQLPARITLDASMAMIPAMSLTDFPKVVVGARISKSGNATAQPGDLEALSSPVDNNRAEPVELQIATVL